MFRNENELLKELAKAAKCEKQPQPLTPGEKSEIEKYRDVDGIIDLTGIKNLSDLQRLVELVDRKNHLEELATGQGAAEELIEELLPLMGIDSARLNITTPNGKASVTVEKGNKPVVQYDKKDASHNDAVDALAYGLMMPCCAGDEKNKNKEYKFKFPEEWTNTCTQAVVDDTKVCEGTKSCTKSCNVKDDRVVVLENVGGVYNPDFFNAVRYICEMEHFSECGVYTVEEVCQNKVDVYVLLPNAFNMIVESEVNYYVDKLLTGAKVYVINPETFVLTEVNNPFDLYEYAMTDAQFNSLR